jgi:phosphoglycerate kinase
MPKQNIVSVDVSGKRVLIRVDFNVPLKDRVITDDRRIRAALPTIQNVIERGGRAICMSHLGRPEGKGYEAGESMKPVAARLGELLGRPVAFPSTDCTDGVTAGAVNAMKDGEVLVLENLRFHKGEKKGDPAFADKIALLGDVYVNDAFGTCHREDASMVAVPRAMPGRPRVVGFLVEKEVKYLSEKLAEPARPFIVVLGGAKVSDKLPAITNLMDKADHILIGGAMAYTFIKALGYETGNSRIDEEHLADAKEMIDHAAGHHVELHLPSDHICSTEFSENLGNIEVFEDHIKPGFMGLDIGPRTQSHYAAMIRKARTVVWNGPMGVFEWRPFRVGTKTVADAMAQATDLGATTIVGGGDSAAAVEEFGVADRMSHVSTGGGASLEMLQGKRFVAVDLLDNA